MSSEKTINVDETSFDQEVLGSGQPVLVDFWGAHCRPCQRIAPLVDELAEEYSSQLRVAKVDAGTNPQLAARYNVISIPVLMVFKDGEPVDQLLGAHPKNSIENMVKKHL